MVSEGRYFSTVFVFLKYTDNVASLRKLNSVISWLNSFFQHNICGVKPLHTFNVNQASKQVQLIFRDS